MDLHSMYAFDWVTDRSINALSGLLIKCVVIRYRCYWLKAVASSIIFLLQIFNQIMPISVYQIVFYWLRWRVPLTWIFCYQFHCQKFIATSLLPCSFIHSFIKNWFSRHRSSQICYYGYYWLYWFMNLNLPTPIPFQKLHIILNLYFQSILLNPKTVMFSWNLW